MRLDDARLRWGLAAGGALACAWAVALTILPGVSLRVGPFQLASHDPVRPLLAGLVCLIVFAWWSGRACLGCEIAAAARWAAARPALAAVALGLAVFGLGVTYGTFVAGMSDAYGYVSQAELWERGTLRQRQPLASVLPWPDALNTLTPIGYRPSPSQRDIVPTYAPGLPLLMVLFRQLLGANGQYYVGPVLGGLAVWLTFLLGRTLTGRSSVGLAAALVAATSPPFLMALMWPMSDVPSAAVWTLALLFALRGSAVSSLASGVVAALGVLIRPNLVVACPAFLIGLLWHSVRAHGVRWATLRSPVAFSFGLLPAVVIVAGLNAHLYGSPLWSGYGSLRNIYALRHVAANALLYLQWMAESGSAYVLAGLVAALGLWPRTILPPYAGAPARVLLGGFVVTIWMQYLLYLPFDAWWYLRFVLPLWPLLIVLAAAWSADVLVRVRMPRPTVVLVGLALVLSLRGLANARRLGTFGLDESRFVKVADVVSRLTPRDAVILSMQHSGSLRYYSGRVTVRWDRLDPAWLGRAVDALEHLGRPAFLVLDDYEEPLFRRRFQATSDLARLEWQLPDITPGVRLYRLRPR